MAHIVTRYRGYVSSSMCCHLIHVQVVRETDYAEVIEPGQYIVYAGGSQPGDSKAPANVLMGSFDLGGDETPLSQCT